MAFDLLLLEKRLPLRLNCNQNYYDMKILRESFLFIVVSLLMGGCNTTLKDEENVKDEQNSIELQALYSEIAVIDEKPWRTLDEAIEIASEVIMRDRPQMRSSNLRELFNIEVLSFNEGKEVRGGKSNEADSSVYVCNLGKNEGYVLVSRDRCVPELLLMHQVGHSTLTLLMRIIHFILLSNDCQNSMKSIDLLLLRKSDR